MKLSDIKERARSRLWVWPLFGLVLTFGAALSTLYADVALRQQLELLFARLDIITGDPDSARSILSMIATAMVSLLVFTFATTMVVIQLASAQYSPRLMRSVLRDRTTKLSLTLFICTFAYATIVLRSVVGREGQVMVPELSLAVTYVLVLASLFIFVMYINHVAQSMRVGTVIARVTNETLGLIDKLASRRKAVRAAAIPRHELGRGRGKPVACKRSGAVSHIDEEGLVELATEHDAVIELLHRVGDHLPVGGALARVHGGDIDEGAILEQISFSRSRTMQQDVAYGIRQLVDIANRALSPGINDPTTAVQAIDGLHDLLRSLIEQPDLPVVLGDEDGHARVLLPRTSWGEYVALATTEIRVYGAGSPQIPRRLEAMLRDLLSVAAQARRPPLEHQLDLLTESVALEVELASDRELFGHPDHQGLGGAAREH